MSEESEIIALGRVDAKSGVGPAGEARLPLHQLPQQVVFNRSEITTILNLYGRKVAAGEWRDYAMDFGRDKAVFSVFQRTSDVPLFRIEKTPRLARKQGAYSVVAHGGMILRRGHDLAQVLKVLLRKPRGRHRSVSNRSTVRHRKTPRTLWSAGLKPEYRVGAIRSA